VISEGFDCENRSIGKKSDWTEALGAGNHESDTLRFPNNMSIVDKYTKARIFIRCVI
jgi:hypothetical protein